jgi:dTDP-4-amino-4,6-dideoxygalactose transaminase
MSKLESRRSTFLSFQPPALGDEEVAAVVETLRSGWLTTGPRTGELEQRVAEAVGARHAVAVASGTAAMHLALVALGVGQDDEVITSPITWPATANVIVHVGAHPVFVDVRDSDLNIDPTEVAKAVTPRTKASASPSSRTRPTRSARRTADVRSARWRSRPASRSMRRRTSPRAKEGS